MSYRPPRLSSGLDGSSCSDWLLILIGFGVAVVVIGCMRGCA